MILLNLLSLLEKPDKMRKIIFFIVLSVILFSCGSREYYTVEVDNPVYKPNTVFESFEDLSTSKTDHLISKYQIDTIFHDETDEFKRILLLRHWIKSVIPIEDYAAPYPGEGNVERILDYALEGQGYDCGYFMRVQNAIMSAYGYVTRTLGSGPGVKGVRDGHHGINEIWINKYNKWFLSDAKYDTHFEKEGVPLSALEVRNEFIKNEAADIKSVKGPDRLPFDYDDEIGMTHTEFAELYTWVSWDAYNDRFTSWPDYTELLLMYEDDYYRNNTWYRNSRPHWAYASPRHLKLVQNRDELYFTPNTIKSEVEIDGNIVRVGLISDTPNFKEYQMKKSPEDEWVKVDPEFELELKSRKYDLVFRAVNLAGVSGPEHKIVISSRK